MKPTNEHGAAVISSILARRSVRAYTGEAIPAKELECVLQAGLNAPTGKNSKCTDLILVEDREILDKLCTCRTNGPKMLEKAGAAIICIGDNAKTDTVIEDCSIAMAYMHLTADACGLGSCWIQGRLRQAADGSLTDDYVRSLVHYPESYSLIAILSLGVIEDHPEGHDMIDLDNCARFHKEQF